MTLFQNSYLLYCNLLFHNCICLYIDELGNKLVIIIIIKVYILNLNNIDSFTFYSFTTRLSNDIHYN